MIKLEKQAYLFLRSKVSDLKTDPLHHIQKYNLPLNESRGKSFVLQNLQNSVTSHQDQVKQRVNLSIFMNSKF